MNVSESLAAWRMDAPLFSEKGIDLPDVVCYVADEWKRDYRLAMDALPAMTTTASAGIPTFLTTIVDPEVMAVRFSPTKAAMINGEQRKGTWLDETMMFPTVEHTGEVTSYGDFANSGHTSVNMIWPQRQSYPFQTIKQYGDRELERAGLGRINYASEIDKSAAIVMGRFENLAYFKGIGGLQNYGLLNDPSLSASLTPATKAATGTAWISSGVIVATANEIYNDILSLFSLLVSQTGGLVEMTDSLVLAMSPPMAVALHATTIYNMNVMTMLKSNFPAMRIETAVQYGVVSATNPEGIVGGNLLQMHATTVGGQETGYCAFAEKMRAHPVVREMSSFKQKVSASVWGSVLRQPYAYASMLGI